MKKILFIALGLFLFSMCLQATILPTANAEVTQLSMGTATVRHHAE